MFPRTVSTTWRVYARVRAQKKTYVHTFRIRKTCTCVTFKTWHPVFHIISHRCTWNEIQPHDFQTYELCMQLLTYETVFEYIVWPIRRTVRCVHCKKDTTLHTVWLTVSCPCANIHIQSLVWEQWFDPREGQRCMFTVKRRPSTQLFDLHGCVRMKMFS